METVRLTMAEALVRYLIAQRTVLPGNESLADGDTAPLFPGVFAIFGHGNVTSLGHALQQAGDALPTWRGQNEQGMALAAIGFAKAARRRQIMVATSSIGPGALNMVTAAGVALANRLPVLLLAGDTFVSRLPDPVLQQVEHFHDPSITVNDAFKPVVRYWDRIVRPEQLLQSLPHAVDAMLDPATCGPAFLALPQDIQAEAFDYPLAFFETRVRTIARPRPDHAQLDHATDLLRMAKRPMIIAGGGVHYSAAEAELTQFAETYNIPVVETMAGKACLLASHPLNAGPIGVTGCASANALAADADLVLAVGTRLQDFTTGSWTAFAMDATFIGINTAAFDATKHRSVPVVGDALAILTELAPRLGQHRFADDWTERATRQTMGYHAYIDSIAEPTPGALPTYAQVVGAIDRAARPSDYALTAAGGFPGELNNGWRAKGLDSFDCEYGFSCMGYEISGAWGAKMAMPEREVIAFIGDGSYMMMNSDLYSSVLSGHKLIVIVCDNGGYAVINRLQINQGGVPFNNQLEDTRHARMVRVDFAAHAAAMGCLTETVSTIDELSEVFASARYASRTTVITIRTDPYAWTEGGAYWEVGVPEVSNRHEVGIAKAAMIAGKSNQRIGI
jgi:3D-(3,5/4)-trihydroxycyclohexane-1,2-dione acylhydrolase (decyclizing)